MDPFDETVQQLVSYCNSSVVRRPFESEWVVRRSLLTFRKQQLEQYDVSLKAGLTAQQKAAQQHAAQQALLLREIGQHSMQREMEAEFQGLRKSESQLEERCQLQREELQQAEKLLAEARPKEEPLVIERYLRTALGNEKKALQAEKARSSSLLREQEKQWLQRMEVLRKENEKELQEKKLQVEADVKKERLVSDEQLQELKASLKHAEEKGKQAVAAKDGEWKEKYARAQERAQERMLEIQVSEMDELQAINDENIEELKTKHEEELDAVEEELVRLRKAEAKHAADIEKAHKEHQEVQERSSAQIAELTSALARSRINDEDGDMSSPSKRMRVCGPKAEPTAAATAFSPANVRKRLTSKKRVCGVEVDQRITFAGPLTAESSISAASTPQRRPKGKDLFH